jgi:hypothetical protein
MNRVVPNGTFSEVFILKADKVVCFARDSQVFILKAVTGVPENEKAPSGRHFLDSGF